MQQISHNHDMNQRGIRATTGMAIALIGAITMTVGFSAGSAVAVDVQTIDLNNNDAPDGVDCPDDVNDYWHFVLAPNNDTFSFVSITLNLEGTSTFFGAGQIISNGGQPDNVWVQVPNGYTFTSIMTAGSSADVAPATGTVSFVLSHLCDGAGTTTTTNTHLTRGGPQLAVNFEPSQPPTALPPANATAGTHATRSCHTKIPSARMVYPRTKTILMALARTKPWLDTMTSPLSKNMPTPAWTKPP